MATLEELIDPRGAGAEVVRQLLAYAVNPVEVFRSDRARGERCLLRVGAPTSEPLGAVAHQLGGLIFDHGWLRLLGAGSSRLARDLASWNGDRAAPRLAGALLVGDDVAGGFFAIDEGAFGGPRGGVWYLAPDDGSWDALDIDYRGLLEWACKGDLDGFYEDARWPGWEPEVLGVGLDQAIAFDPPLGEESAVRRRSRVSIESRWGLRPERSPHFFGTL